MKWIRLALNIFGFSFQYVLPILLFGRIIPYTHGEIAQGLTKMGVIALCVLLLILVKKLKEKVLSRQKSTLRAVLITLIEAIPVIMVALFLKWLSPVIASLLKYWYEVIPCFIVGRLFYVIEETLADKEVES